MLIKHHSDSGNVQLAAKQLCHHYETFIYAQTHAQDIHASLANLSFAKWKGAIQSFLNYWESQWLLIDKSTTITDQELPAVHKSMLCNATCSNPNFLQVEHLDCLGLPQGNAETSCQNYLPILCTTTFQLDLKRPKCSTNSTQVNNTNCTSSSTVMVVKAIIEKVVMVVVVLIAILNQPSGGVVVQQPV